MVVIVVDVVGADEETIICEVAITKLDVDSNVKNFLVVEWSAEKDDSVVKFGDPAIDEEKISVEATVLVNDVVSSAVFFCTLIVILSRVIVINIC